MAEQPSPADATAPPWTELAPIARAAARGQRRAVAIAALTLALGAALALAALHVGLLSPALSSDSGSGSHDAARKSFEVTVDVRNNGLRTERLSTSSPRWPGIEIHEAVVSPREIAAGAEGALTLTGTVTDCAAFTAAGLDVPLPGGPQVTVSAERLWGHSNTTLRADIAASVIDEICSTTAHTSSN